MTNSLEPIEMFNLGSEFELRTQVLRGMAMIFRDLDPEEEIFRIIGIIGMIIAFFCFLVYGII